MQNQLEPIFIETDKARNTTIQVPEAVSEWSDFLVNELYKQHPSLSGKAADVHFQNTDEEQGYATGSIKISDNGKSLLNVPFIIEARRLYPLDVFFASQIDNDPHPLTEDRIREAFFHARLMDGLAPPPRQGDLTNAGMYYGADETLSSFNSRVPPSSMGIAKWGSAKEDNWFTKLAHSLEHGKLEDGLLKEALELTVKEDIDDWKDDILSETGALSLQRMTKAGTIGGIELIADTDAPPRSMVSAAMEMDNLSIKVARIRKDGADNYTVWLSGDEPHELTKMSMPRREVRKIIETVEGAPGDKDMQLLENSGERIFSAIRHNPNDYPDLTEDPNSPVYEEAGPVHRKVNVYDPIVRATMKGWLLGNVIFPSGKLTGNRLFVNPEMFAYQPNMAVEYLDGTINDARIPELSFSYPRAGEMGTFVSQDDQDAGTAMVPFKVLSVVTDTSDADEGMAIRAETLAGTRVVLIPSPHVLTIRPISRIEARRHLGTLGAPGELAYLVPRRFQYVVLGNQKNVARSREETVKVAGDEASRSIEVIPDDGLFHLRGGPINELPLEKWGYTKHSMSDMEAFHVLINSGVPGGVAAETIKEASGCGKKKSVNVPRKPYAPLKKKTTVKEAMLHHALLTKELRGLRNEIRSYPMLKIAAGIPDVATVNNVLSLRFIGPETFQHFASNIPLVEKTLSFLSTLLLSSRIESTMDLDEQEISMGIRLVDNTLQKLKKMKAIVAPT